MILGPLTRAAHPARLTCSVCDVGDRGVDAVEAFVDLVGGDDERRNDRDGGVVGDPVDEYAGPPNQTDDGVRPDERSTGAPTTRDIV